MIERPTEHGGSIRPGRRKTARPFNPRRPLHVVMRSTRARGTWSFLKPMTKMRIEFLVEDVARESRVQVKEFANVGNHLHLVVRARTRADLQRFLRVLAGRIVMMVTGACKGNPVGRFWNQLAYSRIVALGREYKTLVGYIVRNKLEALGAINRYGVDRLLKIVPVVWAEPPPESAAPA